jgi:hypothetical protein
MKPAFIVYLLSLKKRETRKQKDYGHSVSKMKGKTLIV